MLAGFKSRNPKLYADKEPPPPPKLVPREKTLSRGQRHLQRLENWLIPEPPPAEQVEALEKARETMRLSRDARFMKRLEEYL